MEGYVKRIVADARVYPLHATPGVNRGYMAGILDDSLRLVRFTAACGPVVYRGSLFGPSFQRNAFTAEPAANLVKRNILDMTAPVTTGTQAYQQREFIASTDERFRPVNLYNGPDGALYIVDMYRGIIQHQTYLTPYLKKEIMARRLTYPQNCGRIYKVVPKKSKASIVKFPREALSLVKLLGHPNGWVRDKAQQLLIDGKHISAIPVLQENLTAVNNPLLLIHSFWTLEGLGALKQADALALINQKSWTIRMQGFAALPDLINNTDYRRFFEMADQLIGGNDTLAATYLALMSGSLTADRSAVDRLLRDIAGKFANDKYVADAVVSAVAGREEAFQRQLLAGGVDRGALVNRQLQKIITANLAALANRNPALVAKEFPKGALLYTTLCQTCHGPDGEGRPSLGPPLNRSEWVNGDKNSLAGIVLVGLTGPISVNGKLYGPPEINGDMPGIGASKDFTDEDIAQVLSYIRRSWLNNAAPVAAQDITDARRKLAGRQKAFTADELKN